MSKEKLVQESLRL